MCQVKVNNGKILGAYFMTVVVIALMIFTIAKRELAEHPAPVALGEQLYAANCAGCHGLKGEGRQLGTAPTLAGDGLLTVASDEFLIETIAKGRQETAMPYFGIKYSGNLNQEEIGAIIKYLRTFQKDKAVEVSAERIFGSAREGAELYAIGCAGCHGFKGEGSVGPALNNQSFLKVASDGFLYETIKRGRPGTPMPSFSGTNKGLTHYNDQEVQDVVAFIRSWQKQ